MKKIHSIFAISVSLVLSACGGGGSSSGGGGNQFAGVYQAPVSVEFRFTGGLNDTSSVTSQVVLTVQGDGSYSISDAGGGPGGIRANGNLDGNKFRATGSGSDTEDGVSCSLTITYAGSIANETAKGKLTGNGRCTGLGTSANVTLNGNMDLPRTGNAKSIQGESIMSSMMKSIQ